MLNNYYIYNLYMLRLLSSQRVFRISFFKPDSHYDILGITKTAT